VNRIIPQYPYAQKAHSLRDMLELFYKMDLYEPDIKDPFMMMNANAAVTLHFINASLRICNNRYNPLFRDTNKRSTDEGI
jgi:hypothetical protein